MNNVGVTEVELTADVADSGTVTLGYPSGTTVDDYLPGLVGDDLYIMLNSNDRIDVALAAGDGVEAYVTLGSSDITLTNATGETWAAGTKISLNLDQVDPRHIIVAPFDVALANLTDGGAMVTDFPAGVNAVLEAIMFVVKVPVTTASKAATIRVAVDGTEYADLDLDLTSANCATGGAVITGGTVPGGVAVTRASKVTVTAEDVTAFSEGTGAVVFRYGCKEIVQV